MSQTAEKPCRQRAIIAAQAADKKKATDIMVQEVGELIGVADYFIIATAANDRQVEAIVEAIEDDVRELGGAKPLHREVSNSMWMLLDYGDMVVHVFQPEARDYYRLEQLWNDAPVMDLAAEAGLTDMVYSERIGKLIERAAQRAAEDKASAE